MFSEFVTLINKPEYVVELTGDKIYMYKGKSWILLKPAEIMDSSSINTVDRLKRYLKDRSEDLDRTVDNYIRRAFYE